MLQPGFVPQQVLNNYYPDCWKVFGKVWLYLVSKFCFVQLPVKKVNTLLQLVNLQCLA